MANFVATGQVRLAFHHVLDYGEPSALLHRAAECAGNQSPIGFWQMHDLIFERQAQLWSAETATLAAFADELGLDGAALAACMDDPATVAKVQQMDQARRDAGIRLRPTFDVNGALYPGAVPYPTLAQLLTQASTR